MSVRYSSTEYWQAETTIVGYEYTSAVSTLLKINKELLKSY